MENEQIINDFESYIKNIATKWNIKFNEKNNLNGLNVPSKNSSKKEKNPIEDLSMIEMMSEFDLF